MKHISELENILNQYFKWNKSRIGCFVQILQSLFYCRTVNLSRIAEFFQSSAKTEFHYRRIQRFFKEFTFDMSFMVTLVFNLFVKGKKLSLIIDRTNWKFGKLHINIFMTTYLDQNSWKKS